MEGGATVTNAANNLGALESTLNVLAQLSMCDDVLLTVTSSFGDVAAAWCGISPVHIL